MGRAARRAQQIVSISVQEARRESTLQHRRMRCGGCCGCDRMAACYPSEPSCVTGCLVHMVRARCGCGHRVHQAGLQSSW